MFFRVASGDCCLRPSGLKKLISLTLDAGAGVVIHCLFCHPVLDLSFGDCRVIQCFASVFGAHKLPALRASGNSVKLHFFLGLV